MRLLVAVLVIAPALAGCSSSAGDAERDPLELGTPRWYAGSVWSFEESWNINSQHDDGEDLSYGGGHTRSWLDVTMWNTTAMRGAALVLLERRDDADALPSREAAMWSFGGGAMREAKLALYGTFGDHGAGDHLDLLPTLDFLLHVGDSWNETREHETGNVHHLESEVVGRGAGRSLEIVTTVRGGMPDDDAERIRTQATYGGDRIDELLLDETWEVRSVYDPAAGVVSEVEADGTILWRSSGERDGQPYAEETTTHAHFERLLVGFERGDGVTRSTYDLQEHIRTAPIDGDAMHVEVRSSNFFTPNAADGRMASYWTEIDPPAPNASISWRVVDGLGDVVASHEGPLLEHTWDQPGHYAIQAIVHQNGTIVAWDQRILRPVLESNTFLTCQSPSAPALGIGGCPTFSFRTPPGPVSYALMVQASTTYAPLGVDLILTRPDGRQDVDQTYAQFVDNWESMTWDDWSLEAYAEAWATMSLDIDVRVWPAPGFMAPGWDEPQL